ncbi:MAG: hypothetical protein J5835_03935 [Bacteroidales bacterium]|nr:hypothetical protein [Bacteroidales bacterium]
MKKAFLILLAVFFAACTQQALQTTFDKQTTTIESFVSATMKADANATLTRTGGAYRVTMHDTLDPTRDSLGWNGKVKLYYALYTLSSASLSASNLVATNKKDVAAAASWNTADDSQFEAVTLDMTDNLLEGLKMGLYGVQPDDEAYILFTGKYGYGSHEQGMIPARSALAYHVWIETIE